MKKFSVLLSIVILFTLTLAGYIAIFHERDLKVEYARILKKRSEEVVVVMTEVRDRLLKLSLDPMVKGDAQALQQRSVDEIKDILSRNRDRKLIDFFVVRSRNEVLLVENIDLPKNGSLEILEKTDQLLVYDQIALLTMNLSGYAVTIGFNRSWEMFRKDSLNTLLKYWIQDLLLVPFIVFGLVAFFFRDIFKLIRRFDQRDKVDVSDLKAQSAEGEKLKQAILGYEENISELSGARRVFEKQIYSAVREEIRSGQKPPYRFSCTLVRTDLNNYSGIRKSSDPALFQSVIDDLFVGFMDIIAKYKGHVTEFLGDELILYFKDSDSRNSVVLAAACVRDLNDFADEMGVRALKELGSELKMKTALCHGTIEVSEATRGYQFQGESLIESVRILKVIDEKEQHVVLVSEKTSQVASSFLTFEHYKTSELKGLGTLNLMRVCDLPKLADRLVGMSSDRCWELSLYRSERHLIELLLYFEQAKSSRQNGYRIQLALMKQMRDCLVVPSGSERVARAYRRVLVSARELNGRYADQEHEHWLSAVVALSTNLLSDVAFMYVQDDFIDLLGKQQGRILANAVEAIQRESLSGNLQSFELIHHSNNRIVANALVLLGKGEVTSKVVDRLHQMLKDNDPLFVASGLYALGQVASHHRERDLVYFRTHAGLSELVEQIPSFFNSSNEMIRRQAIGAARRIGEDFLLAKLPESKETAV